MHLSVNRDVVPQFALVVVRSGPDCKLVCGEAAEARMRPVGVIARSPFLDQLASAQRLSEHVLVQVFVPEVAVQALDGSSTLAMTNCDRSDRATLSKTEPVPSVF